MSLPLRALIVEDSESDAGLLLRELRRGGYDVEFERVDTAKAMHAALDRQAWDVVLADYSMPRFSAPAALTLLRDRGFDLPFIIVSGTIGEETAVAALKAGAHDFMVKGSLARLIPAIERETREAEVRRQKRQAEAALAARNEELKAMTQQLWHAARLATMGELAASIAHELNNPLGTISLRVEALLAQTPADDPRRRALEIIEQEVERMGALVANLLQFSRPTPQRISTLDVREELEKTLELIHYHLRQCGIAVARDFAPDVPLVQADRQHLRQLFLNLFSNAADAMPQGGTLTIRVRGYGGVGEAPALPRPHTPAHVIIEVADTGVGIAPADLPKVTKPFFTTKPEGKGTGLGLAICRRIAQEHGGTLDLTSAGPGRGATVRVVLLARNSSNGVFLKEAER